MTTNTPITSLSDAAAARANLLEATDQRLSDIQSEIDDLAYELYGIGDEDRAAIEAMLGQGSDEAAGEAEDDDDGEAPTANTPELVSELLDYCVGCCFGRWDIRCATGEKPEPAEPDPFDPLPVCAPGMLQNDAGYPATPADVPGNYPLRISWPGILVDDETSPEDIVKRTREALDIIWAGQGAAIEEEACQLLGVKSLRDFFQKPSGYFDDHLKRFSKSRRKAPLYWPLSTKSGKYTLWLYYHRLTDQTLYTCINDFVEPKIAQVAEDTLHLRSKSGRSSADDKRLEKLVDAETELKDLRDELLRIAAFWEPNLNDGVQITAAPLFSLFKLAPWKKVLKKTWEELEAGKYDWSHLAMGIWPERVVPACHKDRSFAIAHGLEDDLWYETEVQKKSKGGKISTRTEWMPRQLSEDELATAQEEVKARSCSPTGAPE